jgi:toxin ParE1/3/4
MQNLRLNQIDAQHEKMPLYYAERDPGLGLRFIEGIEQTIERILEAPYRWRVIDEDVRRCLTRIFPTIEPDFIVIVAVMHYGREPGYWQQRGIKP